MSPRARAATFAAAGLWALLAGGCATLEGPFQAHLDSEAPQVRACAQWYRLLDERVAEAGTGDAQDTRVPGFPYLRVNRLLAALRPAAASSEAALHALADRMLELDLESRRFEILNLPPAQVPQLPDAADGAQLRLALQRTELCGRLLRELDVAKPAARDAILLRAAVPDDYRTAQRVFGLYWLTRLAVAEGVRRHEQETLVAFRRETAARDGVARVRYAPEPNAPLSRAEAARLLALTAQNPLGIPEPADDELRALLAAYAPSFEIEVRGDADRFGRMRWLRGDASPSVDAARPVVYAHPAWTLYRRRVLLQLVYTLWFPERVPQGPNDPLAGRLDGITWRVTLAPDGEPLVYDAIHPCGCYHEFFPTPRAQVRAGPGGLDEWLFAPQQLPRMGEGERPLVRIASGTHDILRVSVVRGTDSLARYDIRPYGELRSLPRQGGGRASAFGADGLVPGTERGERFFLWPMGIVSAGSMRQWGRHATAFVGRRHFDDADLFEKRFVFVLP